MAQSLCDFVLVNSTEKKGKLTPSGLHAGKVQCSQCQRELGYFTASQHVDTYFTVPAVHSCCTTVRLHLHKQKWQPKHPTTVIKGWYSQHPFLRQYFCLCSAKVSSSILDTVQILWRNSWFCESEMSVTRPKRMQTYSAPISDYYSWYLSS